jgi:hypothetical protein
MHIRTKLSPLWTGQSASPQITTTTSTHSPTCWRDGPRAHYDSLSLAEPGARSGRTITIDSERALPVLPAASVGVARSEARPVLPRRLDAFPADPSPTALPQQVEPDPSGLAQPQSQGGPQFGSAEPSVSLTLAVRVAREPVDEAVGVRAPREELAVGRVEGGPT